MRDETTSSRASVSSVSPSPRADHLPSVPLDRCWICVRDRDRSSDPTTETSSLQPHTMKGKAVSTMAQISKHRCNPFSRVHEYMCSAGPS